MDSGQATAPNFALWSPEGDWVVENEGVPPDVEVEQWPADVLAGRNPRIKASVSVGWMTTGDYQQVYNVAGAIGTFCLLPGVWDRLDVPDLTILAAPNASLVVSTSRDELFPPEGQDESARQIRAGYEWAGRPKQFGYFNPPKPHCYDAEIQQVALDWFDRHLKGVVEGVGVSTRI